MMVFDKKEKSYIAFGLSVNEFKCRCIYEDCKSVFVDSRFPDIWARFRKAIGIPMRVNSGHRCLKHNKDVGGVNESYHTKGMAIDVSYYGSLKTKFSPKEFADIAKVCGFGFTKYYKERNFFHLDIRLVGPTDLKTSVDNSGPSSGFVEVVK